MTETVYMTKTHIAELNTVLAVETTGSLASVALALRKQNAAQAFEIAERKSRERLNHLSELMPMIRELFAEAARSPSDTDVIAVSAGPGSFTGIRIGIATVRALAQTLALPVMGAPTLETFVYHPCLRRQPETAPPPANAPAGNEAACFAVRIACPIFDAKRGQMYAGAFSLTRRDGIACFVPGDAYDPQDFFTRLREALIRLHAVRRLSDGTECAAPVNVFFLGDGVSAFRDGIGDFQSSWDNEQPTVRFSAPPFEVQTASMTAKWALNHGRLSDYRTLLPLYMRKAEAQRKLDEQQSRAPQRQRD
ncbi:MAG: tRNA (adenosine(37)-N6)-threonylcarbamoyltransferase complex dimerization subunit type 1 TsaB [Clostridiales Family XIII bacterium]|jgi:tRNA threonylcarbamoyladenosine biosynthesis protein TsaB|nr:tRNA (adenosine(37)-N6)-threonylcarbamoyltransferase complex dimerization subunit type 1 TsaB [Clostridiales Family XIII bacterium]